MEVSKKVQVAIKRNAKDEIEECLKCEIVGVDTYKAYKKESSVVKAKQLEEQNQKEEENKKRFDNLEKSSFKQNLLVAKVYFDNEVEKGLCETNEKFEEAFNNYVYKGIAFDKSIAPKEYLTILERLY